MAVREATNEVARRLLEISDEIQLQYYDAIANREGIAEAGSLARSIGDRLNLEPAVESQQEQRAERATQATWLNRFKDVVDTTLEWLENRGRSVGSEKKEQILRGLFNLIEMANQAHLFAIIQLAKPFVDTVDDPFPALRQYIAHCLEHVEAQQEQILSLVEQASVLLSQILEHDGVDYLKGRQFDNVVREAWVLIETCRRRMTGADEAITELSQKMGTVKWSSRALRAAGWGFSSYYLFKRFQESSQASVDVLKFGGCVIVGGWLWMSLLGGKTSAYNESIQKLAADHRMLSEKLEDLRTRLLNAKDHRDGL